MLVLIALIALVAGGCGGEDGGEQPEGSTKITSDILEVDADPPPASKVAIP